MTPGVPRTPFAVPVGPRFPGGPTVTDASAGAPPIPAPIVVAIGVTSLTATTVTLVGSINTSGNSGSWWFTWGTTPNCGTVTASAAIVGASAQVPITVQTNLTGLVDGTTYYFALVGKTAGGTVTSFPLSFMTSGAPPITAATVAPSTTSASATTPHFAWPFKLIYGTPRIQYGTQITSNDGAMVVEQDADGDIFACVAAVMNCNVGEWPEVPAFGIPDLTFSEMPPDVFGITSAIQRWEPRAAAELVAALASGDPGYGGQWTINTTIKASS